jgi:hypothetical protein
LREWKPTPVGTRAHGDHVKFGHGRHVAAQPR